MELRSLFNAIAPADCRRVFPLGCLYTLALSGAILCAQQAPAGRGAPAALQP